MNKKNSKKITQQDKERTDLSNYLATMKEKIRKTKKTTMTRPVVTWLQCVRQILST